MTSYANRTSPVLRGKWVLENILGAPPPPPPPNVPALKDRGEDGKILSVRQQMEKHRANPACASCHARMDPLGFALENFDAIGKWRTTSGRGQTIPIDSSGVLPDGTKFEGPAELRKRSAEPARKNLSPPSRKNAVYLRAGAGESNTTMLRPSARSCGKPLHNEYRWSSLILATVKSTPFQMRRSQKP